MTVIALQADAISRYLGGWMLLVSLVLFACVHQAPSDTFFRMGPHADLVLFGLAIDTFPKYLVVVLYTSVSTVVRTLQQEVLRPWIIQQVQNDRPKTGAVRRDAFWVVATETIFIWFDWFMYINILVAQADLMLVEMVGNLVVSLYTTWCYLQSALPHDLLPVACEDAPKNVPCLQDSNAACGSPNA